jgi:hypothetical protein
MLLVVHCIVRTQANQSPPPNGDCILFTEMCGHGTRHGTWHGTLHTSGYGIDSSREVFMRNQRGIKTFHSSCDYSTGLLYKYHTWMETL